MLVEILGVIENIVFENLGIIRKKSIENFGIFVVLFGFSRNYFYLCAIFVITEYGRKNI